MPTTYTPNYLLAKPPFDDIPWDQAVNGNMDKIDALLAQYLSIANFAGVWQNNTTYAVGQVLIDAQDSTMWRCLVVHTSAVTPSTFAQDRTARPTLWTPATTVVTSPPVGAVNIGRNLIHNPLFNIAQRGTGPFTTNVYTADRWSIASITDTTSVTQGQMSDTNRAQIGDEAATYYLANTFTGNAATGAYTSVAQPIEDVRRLAGKTVTVSFFAVAGATLKLGVNLLQYFGSGGSPSTPVSVAGQSVTLTTGFVRYSLTFTLPSVSGKTPGTANNHATWLQLWYSSGATNNINAGGIGVQSGTILLWGVQLEIGSVATPLEKPDPRYDLSNCQRFYQTGIIQYFFYQIAGQTVGASQSLPVFMRGVPTITPTFSVSNVTAPAMGSLGGVSSVNLTGTATATGTVQLQATFTASADL